MPVSDDNISLWKKKMGDALGITVNGEPTIGPEYTTPPVTTTGPSGYESESAPPDMPNLTGVSAQGEVKGAGTSSYPQIDPEMIQASNKSGLERMDWSKDWKQTFRE